MNEKDKRPISSLSLVITAVLLVTAFARGTMQLWLYAAIFVAWGTYLLLQAVLPRLANLRKKEAHPKRCSKAKRKKGALLPLLQRGAALPQDNSDLALLLLGHISCRISDKLKLAFPDATWQWYNTQPETIIRGGTGRISTSNTGDYGYAEVTIGPYFQIQLQMLQLMDLDSSIVDADSVLEADPSVWYDQIGRNVLTHIIENYAVHGFSSLYIEEDGAVYLKGGRENVRASEKLEDFPPRSRWQDLVQCFTEDDLQATILPNSSIEVAW